MIALLAKIASYPLVVQVLIPALAGALARFLEDQASRIKISDAVADAKKAKTQEELREASRKLSDASARR